MTKLVNSPVKVKCLKSIPALFMWRSRWFPVEAVLDCWQDTGCWWEGEPEKTFYRVTNREQVFEIYSESQTGRWYLYRVFD